MLGAGNDADESVRREHTGAHGVVGEIFAGPVREPAGRIGAELSRVAERRRDVAFFAHFDLGAFGEDEVFEQRGAFRHDNRATACKSGVQRLGRGDERSRLGVDADAHGGVDHPHRSIAQQIGRFDVDGAAAHLEGNAAGRAGYGATQHVRRRCRRVEHDRFESRSVDAVKVDDCPGAVDFQRFGVGKSAEIETAGGVKLDIAGGVGEDEFASDATLDAVVERHRRAADLQFVHDLHAARAGKDDVAVRRGVDDRIGAGVGDGRAEEDVRGGVGKFRERNVVAAVLRLVADERIAEKRMLEKHPCAGVADRGGHDAALADG